MTSVEVLRDFINERLTAAAAEIFTVFQQTIVQYEEEIDRQKKLLHIRRKPQIKLHRTELFKWKTNFCLNQEEPEPPQIKEEPELQELKEDQEEPEPPQLEDHQELGCSHEGDQLILKVESGSYLVPSTEEQSFLSDPQEELDTEQFFSQDSEVHRVNKHLHSGSSFNAKRKKISIDLGERVNDVPVSEKQDEGEKLLSEESSGGNVRKKHTIGQISETVTDKKKVCEICSGSCTVPHNLMVQMRTHTGGKPYSCEMCGKSFCKQDGLLRHMRTHTGEKPYSCQQCGKSFSQRCNLLVHSRTHTGEKPYSCEKCVKRFTNRRSLLRHGRAHDTQS